MAKLQAQVGVVQHYAFHRTSDTTDYSYSGTENKLQVDPRQHMSPKHNTTEEIRQSK